MDGPRVRAARGRAHRDGRAAGADVPEHDLARARAADDAARRRGAEERRGHLRLARQRVLGAAQRARHAPHEHDARAPELVVHRRRRAEARQHQLPVHRRPVQARHRPPAPAHPRLPQLLLHRQVARALVVLLAALLAVALVAALRLVPGGCGRRPRPAPLRPAPRRALHVVRRHVRVPLVERNHPVHHPRRLRQKRRKLRTVPGSVGLLLAQDRNHGPLLRSRRLVPVLALLVLRGSLALRLPRLRSLLAFLPLPARCRALRSHACVNTPFPGRPLRRILACPFCQGEKRLRLFVVRDDLPRRNVNHTLVQHNLQLNRWRRFLRRTLCSFRWFVFLLGLFGWFWDRLWCRESGFCQWRIWCVLLFCVRFCSFFSLQRTAQSLCAEASNPRPLFFDLLADRCRCCVFFVHFLLK